MFYDDFPEPDSETQRRQAYLNEKFGSRNNLLRLLISKSSDFEEIGSEKLYMGFDFTLEDQEIRMPLDERIKEALSTKKRIEYLGINWCRFLGATYYDYTDNFEDYAKYLGIGNQYLDSENPAHIINQPVIVFFPKPEHARNNEKQKYIEISQNELEVALGYIKKCPGIGPDDSETELGEMEEIAGKVVIAEQGKKVIYDLDYIDQFLSFVENFMERK